MDTDLPIIWCDVETGGLDPLNDPILEIVLFMQVRDEGFSYSSWIKEPGLCGAMLNPKAMEVNGLTLDKLLADGQVVEDVAADINKFVFASHNVAFDHGFYKRLFRLAGVPLLRQSYRMLDTSSVLRAMGMAGLIATVHNGKETTGLDGAIPYFGIHVSEGRHSALTDARLASQVYGACLKRMRE